MNARRWLACLSIVAILLAIGVWRARGTSATNDKPSPEQAPPKRIASLTLGTDEMLAALVPIERLVCVNYYADDPEISNVTGVFPDTIPRLRGAAAEKIVALAPDLVCVASYSSADFLTSLERCGLSVYRNDAYHTMDEIEAGILDLGRRVGEPARAAEVVGQMRDRRQRLADKLRNVADRPRVLFWSAGATAGRQTTMDDIIREAGAINVAAEEGLEGSAEIAPERVIAVDPEFVIQCQWLADEREGRIEKHPLLRNLAAVREKRVIEIEGKYLTAVSQYIVEGAERLARKLHPDQFPDDRSSRRLLPSHGSLASRTRRSR
jgi:iron complex transport system substrate-binding protein